MSYEILTLCRKRDGELIPVGMAIECGGELFEQQFTDTGQAWAALDLWRRRFAIGSTDDADAIMRRCAEDAAALPRCPRCGDDEDGGRMVNDKCNVCGHRQQDEDDENEIAEPDIERKIHEA